MHYTLFFFFASATRVAFNYSYRNLILEQGKVAVVGLHADADSLVSVRTNRYFSVSILYIGSDYSLYLIPNSICKLKIEDF